MAASALQLIQEENERLLRIEQNQLITIDLLKQRPDELFRFRWIESKKVPPLLGISNRTWQSWRDKRVIPFSQFGSKIYVNLNDLNALLESHKIETLKTF